MELGNFFGYICPICQSTIDIAVNIGSILKCRQCGIPMIPNPNGREILMNITCPNCKSFFGMSNSSKCSHCGRELI